VNRVLRGTGQVSTNEETERMRIRTRKTGVMLNPIMYIDIRQIKDSRLVVPTEDGSDRIRDIPTEGWSEVVVLADELIHLLERNVAAVPWK